MAELGVGYISVIPEVSRISPEIAKALGKAETKAESQGKSMGSKIASGVGTTLKVGAGAAGVAAGGAIAASLTKGMGRLTAIESAESKLKGLGNSAADVSTIMENANAAVKGTAYGLDAAATTAAMAVAAGIRPGQELEQTLKTVADTAGIAGASMDEMGNIFGSVAARGKLQGDDLMQLTSRGIPVLQLLGEELGKTSAEVSEMVSAGEIDFATFERAMRAGVGGAALEAGNTFQGALANMGAAAGRIGATALSPFFDLAKGGFGSVTDALDGMNDRLKPVMGEVSAFIDGQVVPAMGRLRESVANALESPQLKAAGGTARAVFGELVSAGQALLPVVGNIASTLGQVGMQLGSAAWGVFTSTLSATASALQAVAGPLESVTGFLSDHPGLVTAAVAAWAGFKFVPGLIENVSGAVAKVTTPFKEFTATVSDSRAYFEATGREVSRFDAAMFALGTSSNESMRALGTGMLNAEGAMGRFKAAANGVKTAGAGLLSVFGGPLAVGLTVAGAALTAQMSAAQGTKGALEEMNRSVRDGAAAQEELQTLLAGTTGELGEQGLAAAARVAKAEIAAFVAEGSRPLGLTERVNQATLWMDDLAMKIPGIYNEAGRANVELTRQNKETRESYKALEESASKMGLSIEDVNSIVAAGGPEYDQLVTSLRGMGDSGNMAADKLEAAKSAVDGAVDAARRLDPAAQQAAAGVDVLADSAASGEDKLKALQSVLQAMGLAPKDAEQAMMDAAAAVDEIVEAASQAQHPVEQLGDALFDMNGKLDPGNESARELSSRLQDMVGDLQNVAVNGGDVSEAMDRMAPAIAATAEEFGLSEEKVRSLIESYGGVPEVLTTLVNLEGASEAVQDIGALWTQLYPLEEGATIEIDAVGDEAKAVMDELGIKWQETADGKQMVITGTNEDALAKLQQVTERAAALGDAPVSLTMLMDTTPLQVSAGQAQGIIDALDIQNPSPEAQLLIDNLRANNQIAAGDLAWLGAQSPTPKADLDKKLLDNGIHTSRNDLGALERVQTRPTVSVNNEPARRGIQSVKNWLGSIKDRVVNIFTNRHDNAADGLINYGGRHSFAADGMLSRQQAQIAQGGRWITWAEDETQGESFIPHAPSKRKRSTQILAETAAIFGMGLVDRGGNPVKRDGTSVAPTSRQFMADGGVSANDVLAFAKGENVGGKQAPRSLEGAPYIWGGGLLANWGDCSGAMSGLAAFIAGISLAGRKFATGNEGQVLASMGAKPGLGSGARMAFGWFNGGPYGGHTAGTLYFPDGNSINLEMGGGRGNGQIGGAAAGAGASQFTDRAYLPLDGGLNVEFGERDSDYDTSMPAASSGGAVASTSVAGVTLKSGKTVSWGQAQSLYDQAKEYQRYGRFWEQAPTFDVGGRWPSGVMGRNQSGTDELVLTNSQWKELSGIASALPQAGVAINAAAQQFSAMVNSAERQVLTAGRGFGGGFLGSAEIVRDAEQALQDTRENVATQAENITKAEEGVAEARKALTEAEAKGGDNAEAVKRAQEQVDKAEEKLTATRDAHKEALADLEAAERAAVASRFKAASDLAGDIGELWGKSMQAISGLFDELARLAGIVDQTRQAVTKLQNQERTEKLNRLKAIGELRIANLDLERTRHRGAISVAEAEHELAQARETANFVGLTSVEAMSGAMDRFYRTGIFSIDSMTTEQIENSQVVKEALWGVTVAQKQNALDQLEALRKQELAQLRVAQATLEHSKVAGMLGLQTELLKKQTAELNGMTQNQATGAARGFAGIGNIGGGLGKIAGGILAGLAGFAVGGPLGALAALPLAFGGISDVVKGGIDVHNNKQEIGEAWKNLDGGGKAAIILGSGGAALSGVAGGALGGAQGAQLGAETGSAWLDATIGSYEYSIKSKIEALDRRAEDEISAFERDMQLREHELNMQSLDREIDYIYKRDSAEADLEWAKLMKESVAAPTDALRQAFEDAAAAEKERAERQHADAMRVEAASKQVLDRQLAVSQKSAATLGSMLLLMQQQPKSSVSGVSFMAQV